MHSATESTLIENVKVDVPGLPLHDILKQLFENIPDITKKDNVLFIIQEYLLTTPLYESQTNFFQFNEALDAADIGITIWHLPTNQRFRTSKANSLLGLSSAGFKPSDFENMVNQAVHPDDRSSLKDAVRIAIEARKDKKFAAFNYRVIWPNGSVHHLITRGRFSADSFFGATLDITPLKLAEQAIAEQMRKRVEEAENYRLKQTEFIDTLCHELRNPLNGMFGYISALEQHITTLKKLAIGIPCAKELDELFHDVSILQECASQQKVIMDEVLDLSKIDAKKVELDEKVFNPKYVIEHVIAMFSPRYRSKNLIRQDNLQKADEFVKADEYRLRQVLINLISNAIKFTEKGSIKVTAQLVPIAPHLSLDPSSKEERDIPQKNYLECEVFDTGPGMSPEELNNLFKEFGQANKQVSSKHGGTGLGLVISQRLVNLMGGDIQVFSEKGKGTCFRFKILCNTLSPDEKLTAKAEITQPHIDLNRSLSDNKRLSVLIVEDNIINQRILERIIKSANHKHQIANNGKEAVDLYKRFYFDVILMDVAMPIMNGLEATQQIRTIEREKSLVPIPIIGTSGNSSAAHKKTASEAGMTGYLTKPFLKEDIIRLIKIQTAFASPPGTERLKTRRLPLPPSPLIISSSELPIQASPPIFVDIVTVSTTETTSFTHLPPNSKLPHKTGANCDSKDFQLYTPMLIGAKDRVEQTTLATAAVGAKSSKMEREAPITPFPKAKEIQSPRPAANYGCWYNFWTNIAECMTSCVVSIRDCECCNKKNAKIAPA
jgi:signal transduction histidine kinase/ActR/RegA family two-component response regulator